MADTKPPAPVILPDDPHVADAPESRPGAPTITTISQYLKDLSFENPRPFTRGKITDDPAIGIAIGVHTRKADEGDYMVEFSIRVESRAGDVTTFLAELIYVGCYSIANMPEAEIEPFMYIQLAPLLFPYARQILDDTVQRGGYPPLHIEVNAVDYVALYNAYLGHKKRDAALAAEAAQTAKA